jgi:opacity protein-like surface antigen
MLKALKITLLAGCGLVAVASTGFAADLDQPIFVEQAEEYVPVEVGNGWYIRGDIGYAGSHKGGTHTYRTFDPVTTTYSPQTFATGTTGTDFGFGGGVGYQFNDWFRADATIDGYSGKFVGTTVAAQPCVDVTPPNNPQYIGTTCASNDAQAYTAYQFMANAYVDLGTYVGVTPYLGAGAGYTLMSWESLNNSLYCVPGAAACPTGLAAVALPTVSHEGVTDYRFTYSVMAGLGYQASKNVKLDLGYRYSKVAAGDQFYFDPASITAGAGGVQGKDDGYDRHEVRLGFRYSLW